MGVIRVGDIARPVKPLAPEDTLRRAAELLRLAPSGAVPVTDHGRLVGVVTERELFPDGELPSSPEIPVAWIMDREPVTLSPLASLETAAEVLRDTGATHLAVESGAGEARIVSRSEVLSGMWKGLRPPPIAGMATPIGVHLTTGVLRSGPGSLGLFLTGVVMAVIFQLSVAFELLAVWVAERMGFPLRELLASPPVGVLNALDLPVMLLRLAQLLLFLALVRLSPLSGYHAAEHMTVHAIEAGEDLTPRSVRKYPRAHPRCGTNLLVIITAAFLIWDLSANASAILEPMLALVILVLALTWRIVGRIIQNLFTTKPPSEGQLEAGIRAGKELLEKYNNNPGAHVTFRAWLWNLGFLQIVAGFLFVWGILFLAGG